MTYRQRTITDDVIEAMQRGVDLPTIRHLGLIHDDLVSAKIDDHSGYWDAKAVEEIGARLGIPYTGKDATYDYDYIDTLLLEIRHRLTGHRETEIEDAS